MPREHKPWRNTWAITPGSIMRDFMEDRYVTESEIATRFGIPYDHVDSLLSGATPVTPELAPKIGEILGGQAAFWMSLQKSYEETIRRNIAREAEGTNTKVYKMLDMEGRTVKFGMATDLDDAWDAEESAGNGVYLKPLTWFLHPDVAQRKLDKLQRAFRGRKQRERIAAAEAAVTARAA